MPSEPNERTNMTQLGKKISAKKLSILEPQLSTLLPASEKVLSLTLALRGKPLIGYLVITSHRVLGLNIIDKLHSNNVKLEILGGEIKSFDIQRGPKLTQSLVYPYRLNIIKPDGSKIFVSSIKKDDIDIIKQSLGSISSDTKITKAAQNLSSYRDEFRKSKEEFNELMQEMKTSKNEPTENRLDRISKGANKASKRLNKAGNSVGLAAVLFVVGVMFFPLGIIAWVFAVGILLGIFTND